MNQCFDSELTSINLNLYQDGTIAKRIDRYNGVTIGKKYLKPGKIFTVRIGEEKTSLFGNLRFGITLLTNEMLNPFPRHAIPDLIERGLTWIWSLEHLQIIKPFPNNPQMTLPKFMENAYCSKPRINSCKCCLITSYSYISLSSLTTSNIKLTNQKEDHMDKLVSIFYEVEPIVYQETQIYKNILICPSDKIVLQNHQTHRLPQQLVLQYKIHLFLNGRNLEKIIDCVLIKAPDGYVLNSEKPCEFLPVVRPIVDVYGDCTCVEILQYDQSSVGNLQDLAMHNIIQSCIPFDDLPRCLVKNITNLIGIK